MLVEDGRVGQVDEMNCKNVSWRCQQRLYAGEAASKSTVKSYEKMEETEWKSFYILFSRLLIAATFAKVAGHQVFWKVSDRVRKPVWTLKVHLAPGASYLIYQIVGKAGCCTGHRARGFCFVFFLTFIIKSAALHLDLPGDDFSAAGGKAASDWRFVH